MGRWGDGGGGGNRHRETKRGKGGQDEVDGGREGEEGTIWRHRGLTLLSQIATELGSQWKRTWKSGLSLANAVVSKVKVRDVLSGRRARRFDGFAPQHRRIGLQYSRDLLEE